MTTSAALTAPVRETATISVATASQAPKSLAAYAYASEAWDVWQMLSRRRQTQPHADEFTRRTVDGRPGHVWDQSMAEAIRLKHGNRVPAYARTCMTTWLTGTGNAVNVGGRGIAARWWFPDRWNDVRPDTPRVTRLPSLRLSPVGAAAPAASKTSGHEREVHPETAEFVCPVIAGDGQCAAPYHDKRSFGRHLSSEHGIKSATDRERIAATAQTAARRSRDVAAAAQPDDAARPVNPGLASPAAVEPRPAEPVQGTFEEESPAPAPALAPVPAPAQEPVQPVPATVQGGGTDVDGAIAALDRLRGFLIELGPGYTELRARAEEAELRAAAAEGRAAAAEARVGEFQDRLGGLLDLATR
jgi:hypothetical protein